MAPLSGFRFHHFGLATRSDETAVEFLTALGYACGPSVYDSEQNVRLRMCDKVGDPSIEIITPGEGDGPLTSILKRYHQLFYHSCYEVDDRATALAEIERAGFRCMETSAPRPAILFGGRLVSFHTIIGYGLIELLSDR
jgi:methylmalonyl-CoA/ethylmalonyl-CoA epimerase